MPLWNPSPDWKGHEAFVIGGGSSLKGFDFNLLKGKNTIGANDAFRLGSDVVKICLFGDTSWFHRTKFDLENFKGRIVSVAPPLRFNVPWFYWLKRIKEGLAFGDTIAWNFSTGAAAINLAINLGATRIFLLGFDCQLNGAKSHWHSHGKCITPQRSFNRFQRGFLALARELKRQAPDIRVVNVCNGNSSSLPVFERVELAQLKSRLEQYPNQPLTPNLSYSAVSTHNPASSVMCKNAASARENLYSVLRTLCYCPQHIHKQWGAIHADARDL